MNADPPTIPARDAVPGKYYRNISGRTLYYCIGTTNSLEHIQFLYRDFDVTETVLITYLTNNHPLKSLPECTSMQWNPPKPIEVPLTQQEVDVLYRLLNNVGGHSEGPRGAVDSMLEKLCPHVQDRSPFYFTVTDRKTGDPKIYIDNP